MTCSQTSFNPNDEPIAQPNIVAGKYFIGTLTGENHRAHLQLADSANQGRSTEEPVVARPSRSRWASSRTLSWKRFWSR